MEYKGVKIEAERICNIQDGRIFRSINKNIINKTELKYGILSHHTLWQIILSLIVFLPGFYGLKSFILMILEGGGFSRTLLLLAFFFPFGLWILHDALKKGYYIQVIKNDFNKDRIIFEKVKNTEELAKFIDDANRALHYQIMISDKSIL
jgi:hypothetical protein